MCEVRKGVIIGKGGPSLSRSEYMVSSFKQYLILVTELQTLHPEGPPLLDYNPLRIQPIEEVEIDCP